ncbi:T9SS type A sorting domain-containing protein [Sporocytophaga myxococcoides]|uniref:Ig-like domain-containing protein n=1 Tax=Sporocytophaga myxococcoides TaxID=153721 RepID=UPI00040F036C|nr:T9SS type A sorting domain-containing protein [Sporocytophaga myxococcoides]
MNKHFAFLKNCGLLILLSALSLIQTLSAQPLVLNQYAKVLDFPSCNPCLNPCNKVTVDDITPFVVGDEVLLIQMKGADISWAQDTTFGDIISYGSTGFHEVLSIAAINASTKLITFDNTIGGNYFIDGKVQLVKKFKASGNYTVPAGGVTCAPWDGNKGGVLFMEVNGTLSLSGSIDVTGMGFRGAVNPNSNLDITQCGTGGPAGDEFANGIFYLDGANLQWAGRKGEGITEFRNPQYELGTGNLANGGGGGLNHNAGGGGGSNMGAGGKGGNSYIGISNEICGVISNGSGGAALDRMGGLRLFLGGGGGAGHENNHRGNSGGDGGGIIVIKADKIEGNGNKIISDGFIGFNYDLIQGGKGENDGGGGGGAGGSIKIECNDFGTSALTIQARGGNGGSLTAQEHGPGGGGGGGLVCFNAASISNALVKVVSEGGNPGLTAGDTSSYGAQAGSPGITGFSCSTISSPPPRVILFSAGSDQTLCNPGVAILDTKLEKTGTSFTWYKDGVELTAEKDSVYTTNAPGTFVVKVTTANCSSTDTVVIKKIGNEVPVNQYFCDNAGPATVTLEVGNPEAAAKYGWFTEENGGTLVHVGTSYTVSGLTKDTVFYVVDTVKVTTVLGPTGTGAAQEWYIADGSNNDITVQEQLRKFNVIAPIKLKSVEVRAALYIGGCGVTRSVTIQLFQNGVATGQTATGTIQCDVPTKVVLNFDIPPGNNYELRIDGIDKAFFKISDEEEAYSIPVVMTILPNLKKSGAFFNWEIEYGAPCGRMPIWAKKSCPLPLMLLSFSGVSQDGVANLYWSTAMEKNVEGFIIESSSDGFQFESKGFVSATGLGHYQFQDMNGGSSFYYRLKMVDRDGTFTYSPIIHLKGDNENYINLFPNPASEILYLQIVASGQSSVLLELTDIVGKQLLTKEQVVEKGLNTLSLNVSSLPTGVYFLSILTSAGVEVRKFEKR